MSEFKSFRFAPEAHVQEWRIETIEEDYVSFPRPIKINNTDYETNASLRMCFKTKNFIQKIQWTFQIRIFSRTGNLKFDIENHESIKIVTDIFVEVDKRVNEHLKQIFEDKVFPNKLERIESFARALLISMNS